MIPTRHGMDYDADSGHSFLILEDLSETHTAPVTREQLKALDGVPSNATMNSIIDCIADFHAAFWEHPRFGTIPDTTELRWWYREKQFHARHVERRKLEWANFIELYRDEVSYDWMDDEGSKWVDRHDNSILDVRNSNNDYRIVAFDFQDTCVNFPAYDPVYMFAAFWTREQRNLLEEPFLRRYYQRLLQCGIDYGWDTLRDDYRPCLSYMLFDTVWNAASGSSREYWKPKMNCLVDAYLDGECAEL